MALGVDVLRVDVAAEALLSKRPGVAGTSFSMPCLLYQDPVHPSPEGHRLYGELVARYVAKKLLRVHAHPQQANQSMHELVTSPAIWEQCFGDSAQLPILSQHNGSWRIVDEGAQKKVQKLTLLSDRPGDRLSIGPLGAGGVESCGDARAAPTKARPPPALVRAPNATTSAAVDVEIGYKISKSWSYGSFSVHCALPPPLRTSINSSRGCHCTADPAYWSWQLNPFPVIPTNAHLSKNRHYNGDSFNFTITAFVSFVMFLWPADSQCVVEIRHLDPHSHSKEARRGGDGGLAASMGTTSSVRLDSLSMSCARRS
jgi:hypothetical protein